jgi:tRNA-2-methylthio-N6-dimethylallyladenosine synthase
LSTDVIVGFPGETEEDFEATLSLLRQVRFEDAFLYRYSLRDGTPATRLPASDFVSDKTSGRRLEAVISLHRSIQREVNEGVLGSVHEVLIERPARSAGDVLGRTETGKVVAFPGDPEWRNTYRTVRLIATSGPTFRGVTVP